MCVHFLFRHCFLSFQPFFFPHDSTYILVYCLLQLYMLILAKPKFNHVTFSLSTSSLSFGNLITFSQKKCAFFCAAPPGKFCYNFFARFFLLAFKANITAEIFQYEAIILCVIDLQTRIFNGSFISFIYQICFFFFSFFFTNFHSHANGNYYRHIGPFIGKKFPGKLVVFSFIYIITLGFVYRENTHCDQVFAELGHGQRRVG